jgi:uncharacterized membrane protein YeiH
MVAICMGVLTGVGGGIIRDILAREVPMILRTEIYATACIMGGIVHATAWYTFGMPLESAAMLGMVESFRSPHVQQNMALQHP